MCLSGLYIYFHDGGADASADYICVNRPNDAAVIVVQNPASPPRRLLWWAMLCGKCLATPAYVKTLKGAIIRYKGCLSSKRCIFISQALTFVE